MTFTVNPDTLFGASATFLDLRVDADRLLGGLIAGLSGTGGMAGADSFIGSTFAQRYDAAAKQAATGIAKVDLHLGQIANGLLGTAANYWSADAASTMQFPINTNTPARQLQCDNAYAYREEEVTLSQGAGVDTWDVISGTALALVWPQGDTGKMRTAATVWGNAALMLSQLNVSVSAAVTQVTAHNTGDTITAFAGHCAQLVDTSVCYARPVAGGAAIPNLQALCSELSQFCRTAADKIDDARDQIRNLMIAAGIVTIAGIALTVFTLGISDGAAAGIDAGIVAEAEGIVLAAEAAVEAELAASLVAEIEAYLASLASVEVGSAALTAVGLVTVGGVVLFVGAGSASAAPGTPGGPLGPPVPGTPGVPGAFPPLTPAQRADFEAWRATLRSWPETGVGPQYDYQRRVAGPSVYRVPDGLLPPERPNIDADGLRSSDGAMIDSKYTADSDCSPYNLANAGKSSKPPDFLYQKVLGEQDSEIRRYTGALALPTNKATFLEVDVNDPLLVPYYQALLAKHHTKGIVVYKP